MNSTTIFPPTRPALKLPRSSSNAPAHGSEEKWAATLAEERRRLHEDQEALRVREINLREYEARLRMLQAEIEAGGASNARTARGTVTPFVRPASRTPFESDAALHAAWEKLHRARELLASEQNHQRDERIGMRDQANNLKIREDRMAEREARVSERERLLAEAINATPAAQPVAAEHTMSAVARLTSAPFAMARSVFGGKK
ncbi:MAG: hypothetical protein HZA93_27030 [Verrucomicrobia bacterium]|nr:hypothetical protein [Verrucomicrobiota bacterium]